MHKTMIDPHYVYLVAHCRAQGELAGPVKVGFSRTPGKRLLSLQTGNPHCLKIVFQMAAPSAGLARHAEMIFHEVAKSTRLSGEWFDMGVADALATLVKCFIGIIDAEVTDKESAVMMLEWAGIVEALHVLADIQSGATLQ
jgi:hypothetical protein